MSTIRESFPIFQTKSKLPLAYLDSAASTQKPNLVINSLGKFYSEEYSNIHRGAYALSANATDRYEAVRECVREFINAKSTKSIVFSRGATESLNLISHALEDYFKEGDVILVSTLEHHSNIVPWQMLAERKKLKVEFVNIDSEARIDMDDYKQKIESLKPKLVAITKASNAFGTTTPIDSIIKIAHDNNSLVVVDAAQAVAHEAIDVQKMDCDFLVFSGHKLYGPTGSGVLYAKEELLEQMKPFMGGGDMIKTVETTGSTWADIPQKFEAGTPPIAEIIALGEAVRFISSIGFDVIKKQERLLTEEALTMLSSFSEVEIYGPSDISQRAGIVAFNIKSVHPHDFSTIADSFNVQLRAGFHCAMPALTALDLHATARISFGVYSESQDLIQLKSAIKRSIDLFC